MKTPHNCVFSVKIRNSLAWITLSLSGLVLAILFSGCISQNNVLYPASNNALKAQSELWINSNIPKKHLEHLSFAGAYSGLQCETDFNYNEDPLFEKYKQFACTCYNYELKTKQNQQLYLGTTSRSYLWSQICFDSTNEIIKTPNKEYILAAAKHLDNKFISLAEVKSITEIEAKTKFGNFPKLIYRTNEDKIFWEVTRYRGWLNVSVYEFKIDAITGEIFHTKKLPYRRTFWQWLSGLKY